VHGDTIQVYISTSCTGGYTCKDAPRACSMEYVCESFASGIPAQAICYRGGPLGIISSRASSIQNLTRQWGYHVLALPTISADANHGARRRYLGSQGAGTLSQDRHPSLWSCESYAALSLACNLRKTYPGARMGACRVARYSHSFVPMLLRSAQGRCVLSCVAR
jgi:hypothetical protein